MSPWYNRDQLPLPGNHEMACRCGRGFKITNSTVNDILSAAAQAGWTVSTMGNDTYELRCECGTTMTIKRVRGIAECRGG